MNYAEIKKLDEDTLEKLTEGSGPTDKCLCHILAPPEDAPRGIRASIKKAFAAMGGPKKKGRAGGIGGQNSVEIPLDFTKGGKGIHTTKEVVKRKSSCGKCGCDDSLVLNHSYATIRITTPDVSSICPCASDCLPDRDKIANNIKVTVEQMSIHGTNPLEPDGFTYYDIEDEDRISIPEPVMERRPASELLELVWRSGDGGIN